MCIQAQTTQNRSAKSTAPAVSDSFVMHNRTVFVKAGKRLSAASTPKIHFAEKHPYAARTYSPNFLIDISFNFSLLQAFDYDLKSSLQLVYHKLVFQMLRYTVGYGGRCPSDTGIGQSLARMYHCYGQFRSRFLFIYGDGKPA